MQLNVAVQLGESVGSVRNYQLNESIDSSGDGENCIVEGDVKLTRTQRGILAEGKLRTDLEISCSRCLVRFNCGLVLNFVEEFIQKQDRDIDIEYPDSADEEPYIIDEQNILDLSDTLRQSIILAIPMKPLCRQDCAGLCLDCGHNLNQGSCRCPSSIIDPRWSKLKTPYLSSDS